jgi:Fur family ferric uptake transcriptional regulator
VKKSTNYKTKQKESILSYIKSLDGKHVTINQITDYFLENDMKIGISTVYRYLDKLVNDGAVRKYVIDGVSGACYQYVDEEDQLEEHFHFKCDECGGLIHFQCDELNNIQKHLLKNHGFNLNSLKTMFYGKCDKCSNKKI